MTRRRRRTTAHDGRRNWLGSDAATRNRTAGPNSPYRRYGVADDADLVGPAFVGAVLPVDRSCRDDGSGSPASPKVASITPSATSLTSGARIRGVGKRGLSRREPLHEQPEQSLVRVGVREPHRHGAGATVLDRAT